MRAERERELEREKSTAKTTVTSGASKPTPATNSVVKLEKSDNGCEKATTTPTTTITVEPIDDTSLNAATTNSDSKSNLTPSNGIVETKSEGNSQSGNTNPENMDDKEFEPIYDE